MVNIIYQDVAGQINVTDLIMTNKTGDGFCTISPSGDTSWLAKGFRTEYEALIINDTLLLSDSGKTLTNDGAPGIIQINLPEVNQAGVQFNFIRIASFDVRVKPPSVNSIIYSSGVMTVGKYLALSSNGAKLHLLSNTSGNYIATYEFGTLVEEI